MKSFAIKFNSNSDVIASTIQKHLFSHGFIWNFGKAETLKLPRGYMIGVHMNRTLSGSVDNRFYKNHGYKFYDSVKDIDEVFKLISELPAGPDRPPEFEFHKSFRIDRNGSVTLPTSKLENISKEDFDRISSVRNSLMDNWDKYNKFYGNED